MQAKEEELFALIDDGALPPTSSLRQHLQQQASQQAANNAAASTPATQEAADTAGPADAAAPTPGALHTPAPQSGSQSVAAGVCTGVAQGEQVAAQQGHSGDHGTSDAAGTPCLPQTSTSSHRHKPSPSFSASWLLDLTADVALSDDDSDAPGHRRQGSRGMPALHQVVLTPPSAEMGSGGSHSRARSRLLQAGTLTSPEGTAVGADHPLGISPTATPLSRFSLQQQGGDDQGVTSPQGTTHVTLDTETENPDHRPPPSAFETAPTALTAAAQGEGQGQDDGESGGVGVQAGTDGSNGMTEQGEEGSGLHAPVIPDDLRSFWDALRLIVVDAIRYA